jgi:hypothetical protein
MSIIKGVVKGNVVVLPEGVQLADGLEVEVRVSPTQLDGEEPLDPEDAFRQHLFEIGLISDPRPPSRVEPPGRRKPIKIRGKPLSRTILEDRR